MNTIDVSIWTNTGIVEYGIITSASNTSIIDDVETFLELNQNVKLELDWVLVTKWVNQSNIIPKWSYHYSRRQWK